jgi:hypothetical protein
MVVMVVVMVVVMKMVMKVIEMMNEIPWGREVEDGEDI